MNRLLTKNTILWLALLVLFLLAGTIGHDPWWRKGETYSFGMIYHFFKTETWLVPMNAGVPFMEKPPLYYWSATLLCRAFGGVLPLPDAARLTSFVYMLLACGFMWKLSQALFAQHPHRETLGFVSLVLLVGSYGAVFDIHDCITDIALLLGTIIVLYGMALLTLRADNWKQAGLWAGLGVGIAFMSKGLFMPAALFVSGIALWAATPALRTRKTLWFTAMALAAASPFLFIWPYLLYQHSHPLFMEWFWENNIGRFIGFSVAKLGAKNDRLYFLHVAPQYVFPAFWLACIEAVRGWKQQRRSAAYALPLIISLIGLVILLVSASFRAIYLLPLLPGFSLLGAQAFMRIPSGFLKIWNWVTGITFVICVLAIWAMWLCLLTQLLILPALLEKWLPLGFVPPGSQAGICVFALVITAIGLASLHLASGAHQYTARNWLAGMLLLWGLTHTLLLPWINERRSHGPVMIQLLDYVQNSPYAKDCIGTYALDENTGPMIRYFSGKSMPIQDYNSYSCPLILTQAKETAPIDINPHWHLLWKRTLVHHADEEFRLYEKTGN